MQLPKLNCWEILCCMYHAFLLKLLGFDRAVKLNFSAGNWEDKSGQISR